jgi:hypothetical protein
VELRGFASGRGRSAGSITGSVTTFAVITQTQRTSGAVIGVRWPDDFEIARRERVARDDELILMEFA